MNKLKQFMCDEEGASMAEYAILVGLVAAALVGTLQFFKGSILRKFYVASNWINYSR